MGVSAHWVLALVELIYFAPAALPLLYVLRSHFSTGRSGWFFFLLFIVLQCAGSGMIVSAGQNGTPSEVALILVQVGLSPLILGLAGVIHEYARLTGLATEGRSARLAQIASSAYHLAVIAAIAIYAVGASQSYQQPPPASAQTLSEAGVILLFILILVLCATFAFVAWQTQGTRTATSLVWSTAISLVLLFVRIVYSTVSAFNKEPQFNPVTGQIAYQVALVFLPGALIVAAMITGGVMTTRVEVSKYDTVRGPAVPLTSSQRGSNESNV